MGEWTAVGDEGVLVRSRWVYNCYLVPDGAEGSPLVVDVGVPSHGRAVADWIAHSGNDVAGRSGVTVLATHLHTDHVGGLPELEARQAERHHAASTVALPERARTYGTDDVPRSPGLRAVANIIPVLMSQRFSLGALVESARATTVGYGMGEFALPAASPAWVGDGDRLPGASEWTALVAPGHTDDSTVYYHEASRTLASGDAVLTVGGRAWFNPEYVDATASAATADRLRSLRVDVLLPGHGRPLVGRDLLADALGHDERPRARR